MKQPRWLVLPAALGLAVIAVPLMALLARADWQALPALLASESSLAALRLSLGTAAASTVLAVLVGTPIALVLARPQFPGRSIVRTIVLLPLVMPPVVGGIALLEAFGRRGMLGSVLEALGIQVAFSTVAVVLAQTFVAMPFLVISLEGTLRSRNARQEEVAATLGASPARVLWQVTLPLALPGLVSGAVLAFARALGEFGATITFAGSLQGVTRTLPLEIFLQREDDPRAAVALSVLLMVVAALVVLLSKNALTGRTDE